MLLLPIPQFSYILSQPSNIFNDYNLLKVKPLVRRLDERIGIVAEVTEML